MANKSKNFPHVVETTALLGSVKPADDRNPRNSAILLIGDSGAGKTMLACSQPNTLLIDLEWGGSHAGATVRYETQGGYQSHLETATIIQNLLAQKPDENGMLDFQGYKINTIVIDTVDQLQVGLKENHVGMFNKQQMYGILLTRITYDIIQPAMRLPINKIFVAHTGLFESVSNDEKKEQQQQNVIAVFPTVTVALEGGIRNKIVYLFDYVLHLTISQRGTHTILTQPTVLDDKWHYAKDRYRTFGGKSFTLSWDKDGMVDSTILREIWDTLESGRVKEAVKKAKHTIVAELKTKGYDSGDAVKVLGETLDSLNAVTKREDIAPALNVCIEKIRATKHKNAPKEKDSEE